MSAELFLRRASKECLISTALRRCFASVSRCSASMASTFRRCAFSSASSCSRARRRSNADVASATDGSSHNARCLSVVRACRCARRKSLLWSEPQGCFAMSSLLIAAELALEPAREGVRARAMRCCASQYAERGGSFSPSLTVDSSLIVEGAGQNRELEGTCNGGSRAPALLPAALGALFLGVRPLAARLPPSGVGSMSSDARREL
mmetsp:Transcript_3084/g.7103  ORF Transcript_3084/g.7103 Transcript_3084/m.7103 type:complete len:206 (-) Transcript_3084:35-652(-)